MQALNDGSPMAAKPLFDVTPLVPRLERGDTVEHAFSRRRGLRKKLRKERV